MIGFGYYPLINKPTRVKGASATLIDNIFTNDICKTNTVSGIIVCDISDHYAIFHINKRNIIYKDTYSPKRQFKANNILHFSSLLDTHDWTEMFSIMDPQDAFTNFYDVFKCSFDKCFPLKLHKPNYSNRKVWITQALRKSIITKNKLYKKYKENPFLNNERKYKSYRNKLHNLLRSAERNYYQNLVSMHKGNLKKSWQIIKTIIGKKKSDKVITNKFNINNKIVTDPIEIANKFNDSILILVLIWQAKYLQLKIIYPQHLTLNITTLILYI